MRVESKQQFTEGVVSSGGLKIPQRVTIKEKILLSKEENQKGRNLRQTKDKTIVDVGESVCMLNHDIYSG